MKQRVITITDSYVFISDAMPEEGAKELADIRSTYPYNNQVLRVEGPLQLLHILERYRQPPTSA